MSCNHQDVSIECISNDNKPMLIRIKGVPFQEAFNLELSKRSLMVDNKRVQIIKDKKQARAKRIESTRVIDSKRAKKIVPYIKILSPGLAASKLLKIILVTSCIQLVIKIIAGGIK